MKASLTELLERLKDIRSLIESAEITSKLIGLASLVGGLEQDVLASTLLDLKRHTPAAAFRRHQYSASIIALYGAFEQFIESIVRSYAQEINRVYATYASIPIAITDRHYELTTSVMSRIDEVRYRAIAKAQIVANLHSCLSGSQPYSLNDHAFTYHTVNFRHGAVHEAFKNLGVDGLLLKIRSTEPFAAYLVNQFAGQQTAQLTQNQVFECIDDLAERRNEVAHGVIHNTLSPELLLQYTDYVEKMCIAIYRVALDETWRRYFDNGKMIQLGAPISIIRNRIVCLILRGTEVRLGDILVSANGTTAEFKKGGEIVQLQVGNNDWESSGTWPKIAVGMRVEFRVNAADTFFLIPRR